MYPVSFEIAGPNAMFTDPASGSTPCSYPAPTWAALKGIFETVAYDSGAYLRPTHVEICCPVRFERFTTNYGGPLRKGEQIKNDNNLQLVATILVDVCYRVYGIAEALDTASDGINHTHKLQEMFCRRLTKGLLRGRHTPALGWKEFIPTYFGPLREESQADTSVNFMLPSMLKSPFDSPVRGRFGPIYLTDVQVENGVLYYDSKQGGQNAG